MAEYNEVEVFEFHRIGGGDLSNLRLKDVETRIDPPGLSMLRAASPAEVAKQIREELPQAYRMQEAAKVIGSISRQRIEAAGFSLMPDPSRKLPNHFRLIHPLGVAGFTDEHLGRLALQFVNSSGH